MEVFYTNVSFLISLFIVVLAIVFVRAIAHCTINIILLVEICMMSHFEY